MCEKENLSILNGKTFIQLKLKKTKNTKLKKKKIYSERNMKELKKKLKTCTIRASEMLATLTAEA